MWTEWIFVKCVVDIGQCLDIFGHHMGEGMFLPSRGWEARHTAQHSSIHGMAPQQSGPLQKVSSAKVEKAPARGVVCS